MCGTYPVEFSAVLADGDVVQAGLFGNLFDGVEALKHQLDHVRVGKRIDLDYPPHTIMKSKTMPAQSRTAATDISSFSSSSMRTLSLFPNMARVAFIVPSFLGLVPVLRGKQTDPM